MGSQSLLTALAMLPVDWEFPNWLGGDAHLFHATNRRHFAAVCIAAADFAAFLSLHTLRHADCFAWRDQRDNIANATPAGFSDCCDSVGS